jgi:hypothetical protein
VVVVAAPLANVAGAVPSPKSQSDVVVVHNDDLETQGFVYEEPKNSYWKEKCQLDELGVFSHERWQEM